MRCVQRHEVAAYFISTFVISWGGILALVGPHDLLHRAAAFESYIWVPPLILGPSLAGLAVTYLAHGRAGLRDYGARLVRWRVGARWYAAALLIAPIYYAVVAMLLSLASPAYLPNLLVTHDRAQLLVQGTIIALSAGVFEELGWTGFAVPALRRGHGPLATGLVVGVLWGLWHVLPEVLGAPAFGLVPYLALQLVAVIVGLTGYRILMVWVFERTASTLIGIAMHAGLTASLLMLQPVVVGRSLLVVGIVLDVVPWLLVAAVALRRAHVVHRAAAAAHGLHAS